MSQVVLKKYNHLSNAGLQLEKKRLLIQTRDGIALAAIASKVSSQKR